MVTQLTMVVSILLVVLGLAALWSPAVARARA